MLKPQNKNSSCVCAVPAKFSLQSELIVPSHIARSHSISETLTLQPKVNASKLHNDNFSVYKNDLNEMGRVTSPLNAASSTPVSCIEPSGGYSTSGWGPQGPGICPEEIPGSSLCRDTEGLESQCPTEISPPLQHQENTPCLWQDSLT